MSTVRTGPTWGLIGQFVLLLGLAGTVGLTDAGWLAGLAYGVITAVALSWALRGTPARAAGGSGVGLPPGNSVTLVRATLVGGVAALSFDDRVPVRLLVGLTAAALVLDAVDGYVARRTGTVTALGARFDMEVDASLILVLSVYVARTTGLWVLAIGLMRYAFVLAMWALPWLRKPVPARRWRKVVAAIQGTVLAVAAADVLPRPLVAGALAVSLGLLAWSFGSQAGALWRQRVRAPVPVGPRGT